MNWLYEIIDKNPAPYILAWTSLLWASIYFGNVFLFSIWFIGGAFMESSFVRIRKEKTGKDTPESFFNQTEFK